MPKPKATPEALEKLAQVADFISSYMPLVASHATFFFTENTWDSRIPKPVQDSLLQLTDHELCVLPSGELPGHRRIYVPEGASLNTSSVAWRQQSLEEFIDEARHNTLPHLHVMTDIEQLYAMLGDSGDLGGTVIKEFMSSQKSHEVDIMASLCASVAEKQNISKVVDLGSGRGYLGCHLALLYDLDVLGADSSSGNTRSAHARTQRLTKQWSGLLTHARADQARESRRKKREKQALKVAGIVSPSTVNPEGGTEGASAQTGPANLQHASEGLTENLSGCVSLEEVTDSSVDSNTRAPSDTIVSQPSKVPGKGSFISLTQYIAKDTDIHSLLSPHFPHTQQGEPLLLTGLHTCGVLACSSLQLFLANESVQAVCNVGCCYHLLQSEEKFTAGQEPVEKGFPLSSYLRGRRFTLGRTARMLAAQAPYRVAHEQKLPGKSLFWRAVLQQILQDLTCEKGSVRVWQVGKVAAKCTTFQEYVRQALEKLKLQALQERISGEEIEDYLQRYRPQERHLQAYVQLRMALAPCIEALILLDRLVFLLEQDCVQEAYITQLFDPVTSPRCYALLAIKGQSSRQPSAPKERKPSDVPGQTLDITDTGTSHS